MLNRKDPLIKYMEVIKFGLTLFLRIVILTKLQIYL